MIITRTAISFYGGLEMALHECQDGHLGGGTNDSSSKCIVPLSP